jgi:hypothetical protein
MTYARPFVKVNVEGHFGASVAPGFEQWQAGFHVSSVGGGSFDPVNLLSFLTAIAPAIQTYHSTAVVGAGTNAYVDSLSCAYIGIDGKYVLGSLQPTTRYFYPGPFANSGTAVGPPSQSLCITLRSLRLRGPASHGRLYWPALAVGAVASTGQINPTNQGLIATAAQTMFNAINVQASAKFGAGSNVCLVSNVGAGTESLVSSVGIGLKLDHMESRERNLPEQHAMRSLTVTAALEAERDRELREGYEDLDDQPA